MNRFCSFPGGANQSDAAAVPVQIEKVATHTVDVKRKLGPAKKEKQPVSFCICDPASGPRLLRVPAKMHMPVWKDSGVAYKLLGKAAVL